MNIKELRETKNKLLKKDYNSISLLQIIYELDDTTPIEELTEKEQEQIIYGIYDYYIESDGLTLGEILHNFIDWVRYNANLMKASKLETLKSIASFDAIVFKNCINDLM